MSGEADDLSDWSQIHWLHDTCQLAARGKVVCLPSFSQHITDRCKCVFVCVCVLIPCPSQCVMGHKPCLHSALSYAATSVVMHELRAKTLTTAPPSLSGSTGVATIELSTILLYRCSVLNVVVFSVGSAKYEKARSWNIPVVSVKWLTDLIVGDLSVLKLPINPCYTCITGAETFNVDLNKVSHLLGRHSHCTVF